MLNQGNSGPTSMAASFDEIPAAELIRITRAFTRRITNQDRQRLALALRESGHYHALQTTAPAEIKQFFAGEIDLDDELGHRYANASLLSHVRFTPQPGNTFRQQRTATFSSQDDSMAMSIDAYPGLLPGTYLEFSFILFSTFALRFLLHPIPSTDARRWLELMQRDSGITFLWTLNRWEQPYFVSVIREHFARFYAFSPQGYEAAVRLTPDMVSALCTWLEGIWFPPGHKPEEPMDSSDTPHHNGAGDGGASSQGSQHPAAPDHDKDGTSRPTPVEIGLTHRNLRW